MGNASSTRFRATRTSQGELQFNGTGFSLNPTRCSRPAERVRSHQHEVTYVLNDAESLPMQCPKCHTNDQIALHDPWSGRPVIACKACCDYVEDELAEHERAYAIIADVVAFNLIGRDNGGAQRAASEILKALENSGLIVRRA